MQMLDFFSEKSKQNIVEGTEDAFSKGYATREEVVTTKAGRQIPFFLNGKLVKFQNKEYLIGLGIDISDRKILEGQVRQAQKTEAVGTLAGGVAHDFNNLLSVINGHSELALMKIDDTHSLYKDISSIKIAGDKSVNLTRQLLAFSRKQVYKSEALDINRVIADLTKMLRRLIEEDISVQMELIPDPPIIMADPGQIEQILINLVVNAKDAINTKTDKASEKKITIETKKMYIGEEYIDQHQGITEGHYLMFAVSDTGIGMDEDTKQKIFEPFFTTKGIGKGTGLGMATVYGIVKQNEGSIYAYSEPGKGTTFRIYWPATEAKAENNSKEQISAEAISGFGETILIVEDDEGVRNYTVTVLKSFKYRVYSAENGSAALKLIDKEQIKLDLLITDLVMPEMNGKELAEKFNKIFPEAGVIFMSGYTDNNIVHQGALKRDVNFIQKPYADDEFVQIVRRVLDHGVDK